jgi:hypothetical protein
MSAKLRMLISASFMFLFFGKHLSIGGFCTRFQVSLCPGLIPSIPPVHFNKQWFPSTRFMYTLHLQATQNGMMLMLMAIIGEYLQLSPFVFVVVEISANIGAWFNVLPWIYAAYTGAILNLSPNAVAVESGIPLPHNGDLVSNITIMLGLCTVGDIISWLILFVALVRKYAVGGVAKSKKQ